MWNSPPPRVLLQRKLKERFLTLPILCRAEFTCANSDGLSGILRRWKIVRMPDFGPDLELGLGQNVRYCSDSVLNPR